MLGFRNILAMQPKIELWQEDWRAWDTLEAWQIGDLQEVLGAEVR
jgi:hypothetical protein